MGTSFVRWVSLPLIIRWCSVLCWSSEEIFSNCEQTLTSQHILLSDEIAKKECIMIGWVTKRLTGDTMDAFDKIQSFRPSIALSNKYNLSIFGWSNVDKLVEVEGKVDGGGLFKWMAMVNMEIVHSAHFVSIVVHLSYLQ